ncbi:MAG TPA: radical SAM protein [Clostridiales bacterium]|nr:radical SAM protein [Clostridiales bacterium]
MLQFHRLISGGIITNYHCSSKCRHCLYGCSPAWPREYMGGETAAAIFSVLRKAGCHSVHIGGGEPLLQPEKLFRVLEAAREARIRVEYVETNASWYGEEKRTQAILKELLRCGVDTLLISIDPFHNEYIPFCKTWGLMEACEQAGMDVFPWRMEFWDDLAVLDPVRVHPLEEAAKGRGDGYVSRVLQRYGMNFRGRALRSFSGHLPAHPTGEILAGSLPCMELEGIHHFHVDLYGNFVPERCAGLSMHFMDLGAGADPKAEVDPAKYPLLDALHTDGIRGLHDLAVRKYDFRSKEIYAGKCDLCYDIRRYLVMCLDLDLPDLQPAGHYRYME